jgi:serine/threonine-protein kinase
MFCTKCGKPNDDSSAFCTKCGATLKRPSAQNTPQPSGNTPVFQDLTGQIIDGKYQLTAKIGSGGMGNVYRAKRIIFGDEAAIKILHLNQSQNPQATQRFLHEAQTSAKFKHTNAVAIYDIGTTPNGLPFLVMELVQGKNLRQLLREKKIIPLDLIVTITMQTCSALDEAHRLGIIHRDIKPENIILSKTATGWQIKVLDFGIAKIQDDNDLNLTLPGNAMGTPQYMSPEQCLGEKLDSRSDIYSFGVVLYEMLCGSTPFNSAVPSAVVVQHVNEKPQPLTKHNPEISKHINKIVIRALEKKCEKRPQTAGNLAKEFLQAVTLQLKVENKNSSENKSDEKVEIKPIIEVDNSQSEQNLAETIEETQVIPIEDTANEEKAESIQNTQESENLFAELEEMVSDVVEDLPPQEATLNKIYEEKTEQFIVAPIENENLAEESETETKVIPDVVTPSSIVVNTSDDTNSLMFSDNYENSEVLPKSKLPIFAALGVLLLSVVGISAWYFTKSSAVVENPAIKKKDTSNIPNGMVFVSGGEFTMGNDKGDDFEKPAFKATVKPFYIDIYEVTCADYKKFIDAINYKQPQNWKTREIPAGWEKRPVTGVNWDDANAYAKWAGKRLPTETEWEFAARGTDGRIYPWGNEWKDGMANANKANNEMKDVGSYQGKSPFGLYDMVGNAWEWTADDAKFYKDGKSIDTVTKTLSPKVIRGGFYENPPEKATVTFRRFWGARDESEYINVGFRCAKDL